MADHHPPPVRVNRAPVLTLWASIVAEALGHPEDTALTLGSAVAGTAAQAKARRLGLSEPPAKEHDDRKGGREPKAPSEMVRLLGREVPVVQPEDGPAVAARDGKPQSATAVRSYLGRAFGERLEEVRAAMRELAAALPPEELERRGFRLYEAFRPEVPEDVRGWGAKGLLRLDRIRDAADGG